MYKYFIKVSVSYEIKLHETAPEFIIKSKNK